VNFDGGASSDLDGSIAQYDWDFDDGNTAIDGGLTPSNTYALSGNYNVTLTVTDDGGATDSQVAVAAIGVDNVPPTADSGGPYPGAVNQPVNFDGSGSGDSDGILVSAEWDFGDGEPGSGLFPTHTYTDAGPYTANLTVTDNDGVTGQSSAQVVIGDGVGLLPTADADGPYEGVAGAPVTFDGTASEDPDGMITDYAWEFGDDNTGTGQMPDNTYIEGGVKNVILDVTDDDGLASSDSTIANIGEFSLRPTADANGPYSGTAGAAVTFDGTSTDPDGTIVSWEWDFGDDNNGIGEMPSNTYAADGTYIVKLTVTDNSGEGDVDVTAVVFGIGNLPPSADADGPYPGEVDVPVSFDGSGSEDLDGMIVSYEWDFGDETMLATEQSPDHPYDEAGAYFVTLTVTDNMDAVGSDGTLVTIPEPSPGLSVLAALGTLTFLARRRSGQGAGR